VSKSTGTGEAYYYSTVECYYCLGFIIIKAIMCLLVDCYSLTGKV